MWNPFKRNRLPKMDHPVELAFTIGGIDYFNFVDAMDAPYERALAAMPFYEEMRMRCDREFLIAHTEAVDGILNNPKSIQIGKLAVLNKQLQERLNWIMEPDLMYKLASVVFFDKSENPYIYDFRYGQRKIELWKRHKDTHAFFLQTGVQKLVPFLNTPNVNFQIYLQTLRKANLIHLEEVLSVLSEKVKQTASGNALRLRVETLRNSMNRVD